MSKLNNVITKVTIAQIPENALLDSVVRHLKGRETYKDADDSGGEPVYFWDVFDTILGELGELEKTQFKADEKTIKQLEELAKLIGGGDYEYVQIVNR